MYIGMTICPNCGSRNITLLSTTKEWKYHCERCKKRFNEKGEVMNDK